MATLKSDRSGLEAFAQKRVEILFSLVLPVLGKTNALNFGVRGRAPIMPSDPHA